MVSIGELERGDDWKSRIFYKILSFVSGQDLAETERQRLRKHRKKTLDQYREVGLGTPELNAAEPMDAVIDMGLKEARLLDDFEPDLLIVTPMQYKELFDIPASVALTQQSFLGIMDQPKTLQPPMVHKTDAGEIEVTYSKSADGMLLVESDSL